MSFSHTRVAIIALGLLALSPLYLAAGPIPSNKPSHYPAWWFERDVIPRLDSAKLNPSWPADYPVADDFSVANVGQLKQLAAQAAAELNAHFADAGPSVNTMVVGWRQPAIPGLMRDDYAALNQGQLKTVAKPFYDRLAEAGYVGQPLAAGQIYPWTASGADDDSYAVVNLGQLKHTFSFVPTSPPINGDDSDNDGLPDTWEQHYFGSLSATPTGDYNGNGVSNLNEYIEGTDPTLDYYQGVAPLITIIGGDHQTRRDGAFLPVPLMVLVTSPQGVPLVGAPVRFTLPPAEGLLATEPTATSPLRTALTVFTDNQGHALVWQKCP